jgi:hypothetical protein
LTFGAEIHTIRLENFFNQYDLKLKDNYSAIFAETEFYASSKLAIRAGLRTEYTSVIDRFNIAPRISLAQKTGQYSQVSLAAGRFYQTPEKNYLYFNQNLDYELADHLILNYQRIKNDRTFRIEAFAKKYGQLVSEKTTVFDPNPYRSPTGKLDNSGKGYANGFDVFFRDKKTLKNADVWVTYSYLDTERQFRNYTSQAMPSFATNHNFSVVYKQFFPKIGLSGGATYTYTSGRPVYDYGSDFKNPEMTTSFQNLSLVSSYLKQVKNHFMVFYVSVDNVLGRENFFGYRYSQDGKQRFPVLPVAYRTLFFGVSWSIGKLDRVPKEANLDI